MAALLLVASLKLLGGVVAWCVVPAGVPGRSPASLPPWLHLAYLLVFATSGLLLTLGGRRDPRSRLLGAIFMLFASIFADPLLARAAPFVSGGVATVMGLVRGPQPVAFLPLLLWRFADRFPAAQSPLSRWLSPPLFMRLSWLVGMMLFLASLTPATAPSAEWLDPAAWLAPRRTIGLFWLAVALLMLPALAFMISKIGNALPQERRRVRLFVSGLLLGIAPMLVDIILAASVPAYSRYFSDPDHRRALGFLIGVFVLLVPVATAYAVVVDRVLDVSFIVRRAIQYALARYTILAALVVPLGLLAWHVYRTRTQPLTDVFGTASTTGWWLLFAAAVALLGVRRPLLTALDRRFFREQYDMRRILAELTEASRKAAGSRELGALVAGEVGRALHVDRIAVLIRDASTDTFRDPHAAVAALPCASPLATLVGGAGSPLDVELSSAGSPLQRLPQFERAWLADAGAQLLVPFLGSRDQLIGILILGDKLSDAPFTQEDRMLLTAAVSSAALALDYRLRIESDAGMPAPLEEGDVAAAQCARCGSVSEHGGASCLECGGALRAALLPLMLKGKFRVQRQIGAGGMGVVYLAHDLTLDRLVALKTLPRISPEETARLRREARSMASLHHENLAVIHGSEIWRGLPVLVLEFLAGGTLMDRVRQAPLPPQEVVTLGLAMAGALNHLHRSGLLHRDIKPSNIGFGRENVPKLLDFGLARLVSRAPEAPAADQTAASGVGLIPHLAQSNVETVASRLVGTVAYMSPEAIALDPPDPSFDLWSLGVTLFEAAAGTNPFAASNLYDTVHRITSEPATDICDVLPECPAGLARFFRLALARQRELRPSSAPEFAAALDRLAANE